MDKKLGHAVATSEASKTLDELRARFGRLFLANWQQLGGANIPIRLVAVRGGGGVTTAVESALLQGKPIGATDVIYVQSGAQVPPVVAVERGALGLAQLTLVRAQNLPELVTDRAVE